jgi:hypothetical protein
VGGATWRAKPQPRSLPRESPISTTVQRPTGAVDVSAGLVCTAETGAPSANPHAPLGRVGVIGPALAADAIVVVGAVRGSAPTGLRGVVAGPAVSVFVDVGVTVTINAVTSSAPSATESAARRGQSDPRDANPRNLTWEL